MKTAWNRFRTARLLSVVFLIIGLELQIFETFVLNEPATSMLVNRYGAEANTTHSAVQRAMVEAGSSRATWTPAPWLGRSLLSLGVVLLAYGTLARRWK